ncbi:hypothetical protein HGM15179_014503 [Zosterops borbonicus]|uniref:Keratin n=1 Tax=Zosterops borbonicus TaxID=364589 RepID=A0A8K1G6Q5_9PASS|nr:hypothetical protein HGM15179_014503 [Zosterops borbonicus]
MSPFHDFHLPPDLLCPEPFAVTRNETCVIKYPDTVVDVTEPDMPPCWVIYPGPTLTTFPQQTLVATTALLDINNLLLFHGFGGSPQDIAHGYHWSWLLKEVKYHVHYPAVKDGNNQEIPA